MVGKRINANTVHTRLWKFKDRITTCTSTTQAPSAQQRSILCGSIASPIKLSRSGGTEERSKLPYSRSCLISGARSIIAPDDIPSQREIPSRLAALFPRFSFEINPAFANSSTSGGYKARTEVGLFYHAMRYGADGTFARCHEIR